MSFNPSSERPQIVLPIKSNFKCDLLGETCECIHSLILGGVCIVPSSWAEVDLPGYIQNISIQVNNTIKIIFYTI